MRRNPDMFIEDEGYDLEGRVKHGEDTDLRYGGEPLIKPGIEPFVDFDEDITWRYSAFAGLPDIIQEALQSTGDLTHDLRIHQTRRNHSSSISSQRTTSTLRLDLSSTTSSNISPPDPRLFRYSQKFGPDLTANFIDIKLNGPKAFFSKLNDSIGDFYSLCACATGYIWLRAIHDSSFGKSSTWLEIEIQIGTFALETKAISISSIPCQYKTTYEEDLMDGKLATLCATVMAKYLKSRMEGLQYEEAIETAIRQSRENLAHFRVVDPGKYDDFSGLLRRICEVAPMPPTSVVSEISRGMIFRRWLPWIGEGESQRWLWFMKVVRCVSWRNNDAVQVVGDVLGKTERRDTVK